MIIRDETAADRVAIAEVTQAAFANHPFSRQTEAFIVDALRKAGALAVSLVAEEDNRVVGHIAFSRVTITDGSEEWYGAGPLSVLPACQRRGVGTALVKAGLARLKELGGQGCCLVGDPQYYKRFGFRNIPGFIHEGIPQEFFVTRPFGERVPQGAVAFHEGFGATGPA